MKPLGGAIFRYATVLAVLRRDGAVRLRHRQELRLFDLLLRPHRQHEGRAHDVMQGAVSQVAA